MILPPAGLGIYWSKLVFSYPNKSSATERYLMQTRISRVRSLRSPLCALDIPACIRYKNGDDELIGATENRPDSINAKLAHTCFSAS